MNIFVIYQDLPIRTKAFTRENLDGSYTIILNSRHCWETQIQAYKEEMKHIEDGDFDSNLPTRFIEIHQHI